MSWGEKEHRNYITKIGKLSKNEHLEEIFKT